VDGFYRQPIAGPRIKGAILATQHDQPCLTAQDFDGVFQDELKQ
jgi:hypothetical protein